MDLPKSIAIGSDHAGYDLKESIKSFLCDLGVESEDHGTYSADSVDYPDFGHAVANSMKDKPQTLGILICGTANGIAMTANKHQHIRAAIAWQKEIAEFARTHNDANILCLPARFIEEEVAKDCVKVFLTTEFEGGRHARRVNKIPEC